MSLRKVSLAFLLSSGPAMELCAQNHSGALARGNQTQAKADICTEPYKAICSGANSPEKREQILQEIRAGLGPNAGNALKSLSQVLRGKDFSVGARDYANVVDGFYSLLMDQAAKSKVTESQIRDRISEIRTQLVVSLAGQSKAQSAIESETVVMPSDIPSASPEMVRKFYLHCGIDGMAENAFYTDEPKPSFVVCSGSIFQMLARGAAPEGLDFVVAHEMSHALRLRSVNFTDQSYRDFLACLREDKRMALVEPLGDYPGAKEHQEYLQALSKKLNTPVDAALSHGDEMMADAMASKFIAKSVARKSAVDARRSVVQSLSALCQDAPDDSTHPTSVNRIEFVLSNPALRSALGCGRSPASRHWCEVKW